MGQAIQDSDYVNFYVLFWKFYITFKWVSIVYEAVNFAHLEVEGGIPMKEVPNIFLITLAFFQNFPYNSVSFQI